MDFVDRMMGQSSAQRFNSNSLLKFTPLSVPVQKHLEKVYATLAAALVVAALGAYVQILTGLSAGLVGVIGGVICMTALSVVQPTAYNISKRYGLLAGAAFCNGFVVGPLVDMALGLHPAMVLTAFLATASIFACFSGAAMMAKRRSWLYLGGTLSSAISVMMVMRLGTWFFGGRALVFQAELYVGLLVFVGYILVDTQVIIEKAYENVQKDHVKDALSLFVDFMAIFVRVLVILIRNQERKEERRERKRR
ncbi:g11806 [Coccomyxa viridis]|uniref:G11806 protein n=1 Tax=Coccomyxa viridis TaxID=1274662 RepID=A0ABP1GDH8_9CHLO